MNKKNIIGLGAILAAVIAGGAFTYSSQQDTEKDIKNFKVTDEAKASSTRTPTRAENLQTATTEAKGQQTAIAISTATVRAFQQSLCIAPRSDSRGSQWGETPFKFIYPEEKAVDGIEFPTASTYWINDGLVFFTGSITTKEVLPEGTLRYTQNSSIWKGRSASGEAWRLTRDLTSRYEMRGIMPNGNLLAVQHKADGSAHVIVDPENGTILDSIPGLETFAHAPDYSFVLSYDERQVELVSLTDKTKKLIYTSPPDKVVESAWFVWHHPDLVLIRTLPMSEHLNRTQDSHRFIRSDIYDLKKGTTQFIHC